jgi:formylglycine-generating enzyme required for sulfatase activity
VAERAARTEAERTAAEAARLEAERQAAARAQAAEERRRAQVAEGLSEEAIRTAQELANWEFVKDRNDVQDLRDHLARFPGGTTARYALAKLDQLVWVALGPTPDIVQLRAYLDQFPKGSNAAHAQARIAALEKEAAGERAAEQRRAQQTAEWGAVAASTDRTEIEAFLKQWPKDQHADAARARIRELRRGSRGMLRGLLLGSGATVAVVALSIGGWVVYHRARLLPMFWDLSLSVLTTQAEGALKPGSAFKECTNCPEMVVVPAGSFAMGSKDGCSDEKPQHQVAIPRMFAVGKFEVTFDEWDACVAHGACKEEPFHFRQWERGRRPAFMLTWDDVKQYVTWIAKLTGKRYRLLSEAEWEYAARAGTMTDDGQTPSVSSFKPNAFGLYDMVGNIDEWVEDCGHYSYVGAPSDGSAWTSGNCSDHVLRGGSSRLAQRHSWPQSWWEWYGSGVRVARTLTP